jgi:hypothetical protein
MTGSRPVAPNLASLPRAQPRSARGWKGNATLELCVEVVTPVLGGGTQPRELDEEDLRKTFEPRAGENHVRLGLEDAYALLKGLGDSLGEKFWQAGLNERGSVLTARNRSVLPHWFEPVSESVVKRLWHHALDFAEVKEDEPPSFPKLGGPVGMAG